MPPRLLFLTTLLCHMILKQLYAALFFLCAYGTMGQSLVQGQLLDAADDQPIPFAVLQRTSDERAVMTNDDGEFAIELAAGDALLLRHVGYDQRSFTYNGEMPFIIKATARIEELPTVDLQGENAAIDLFWDMVKEGRKRATEVVDMKSFYRLLTTEVNGDPYEYLEAFYQSETGANGIESINPKSGRYAFVEREERFFSADLSRILPQLRLFRTFGDVDYLPVFPSALSRKKVLDQYELSVERIFYGEESNTIEILLRSREDEDPAEYIYWVDTKDHLPVRFQMKRHRLSSKPIEAVDDNDAVREVEMGCTMDFGQRDGRVFVEQCRLELGYTYLKLGAPPKYLETEMNWFAYRDGKFTNPVLYSLSEYHTDFHYYARLPDVPELWNSEYAVLATEDQLNTIELFKSLPTRGNFFSDSLNGKKTFFRDRELPMVWRRISKEKPEKFITGFGYVNDRANGLVFDFSVNSYCYGDSAKWYVEPEFVGEESYFREDRTDDALRYVRLSWKITVLKAEEFQQQLNAQGACLNNEALHELHIKKSNELNDILFDLSSQTADGKYAEKLAEWESRYE